MEVFALEYATVKEVRESFFPLLVVSCSRRLQFFSYMAQSSFYGMSFGWYCRCRKILPFLLGCCWMLGVVDLERCCALVTALRASCLIQVAYNPLAVNHL